MNASEADISKLAAQNYLLKYKIFNADYSFITGEYSNIDSLKDSSLVIHYNYKTLVRGYKHYELSNHLGNVLAVISDKRITLCTSTVVSGYEADVISASDYYPFGMLMSDRSYSSPVYRYGFNGIEKIDEINGEGNEYSSEYRQLDVRLGRWLSIDELEQHYPGNSPYIFVRDNPLILTDVTGLGDQPANKKPVKEDVNKAEKDGKSEGAIKPVSPATPLVNPDGSPNKDAYNCHSYAWENCQGSPNDIENQATAKNNPKWDNNPENNTQGYKSIPFNAPNQVGDKIIYYNLDINGNIVPTHSAVVTKVDKAGNTLEVISKWGQFGVYKHHPRDVPDAYSTDGSTATSTTGQAYATRVYYRKTTHSDVKVTPQSTSNNATKVSTKEIIHPSNATYYKPAFIKINH